MEVAQESWLDPLPGTIQEEVEDKMDTAEAYEMMNGMYEIGLKEFNL